MAESAEATGSEPTHILALDGVRGIAILLVLLHHFMLAPVPLLWSSSTLWIDRTVGRMADVGWAGVDLFFVLSGFLITRILLGALGGRSYFRSFYARRALRIFPVYYGFLLFLIVILPEMPGLRGDLGLAKLRHHQVVYWTYFYNIAISLHPSVDRGFYNNGHLWSLAVEEQFYLIWPLVVFLLGRRGLGVFCVLCIIAAPIIRYSLMQDAVPQLHNNFAVTTLMPSRMDDLAIGGLLAVVANEPSLLRRVARWAIPVGALGVLVFAIMYLRRGGFSLFDPQVEVLGLSVLAVTFASLLTIMVGGPPGLLQAVCRQRVLTFFGRYSYGIYVLHHQIMLELVRVLNDHGGLRTVWGSYLPGMLGFSVVGTAISVAAAWLSWHLYEQQFLKLKRFVPYGRAERRVAAAQLTGRRVAD